MKRNKKIIAALAVLLALSLAFVFYNAVFKWDAMNVVFVTTQKEPEITPTPEPTIKPAETVKFVGVGDNLIHGMLYLQAANRAGGQGYDFGYAYENIGYYYSFNTNSILCGDCYNKLKKENSDRIKGGWYISLSMAAFYGIAYIVASETKKVFSFKVDDKALQEIVKIADRLYLEQLSY